MTPAKELFTEDDDALRSAAVGIARSGASTELAFSFGHPSMKRTGPKTWNATTAPASILSVGPLQLWVITPFIPADIETLAGVRPVSANLRPCDLAVLGHPLNTNEAVVVDYGEDHNAAELAQHLADWGAQQDSKPR